MSPAVLSLLLSLAGCTLLRGTPLPPREVRLWAQNFHVQLQWEPDPRAPNGTTYQAEWRRRTSRWTRADACWGNGTGSAWGCELYFREIHDIYWARVRAVEDGELSQWVGSSELQPYRDTIVGPPSLSWLLQGHKLSINVTAPLTPYRSKQGSYRPLNKVLRKLRYQLHLYQGDVLEQQVPCRWTTKRAACTFRFLVPSTQYCIRTVAVGMAPGQSREAEQCMVTPAGPAGFPWVLLTTLNATFLLLSMATVCLIRLYVFPKPSETLLPNTLALPDGSTAVPTLKLQEDVPTLLLQTSREPKVPASPPLLGEQHCQEMGGYCSNGFGTECHRGRDTSCTQPGHALRSWASSQLEEDEEEGDGDAVPSPDSSTSNEDYGTSEMCLSLRLQLYSTCRWPAPGAGSSLPPALQSISSSPGELQESTAVSWVPLSSVRLLGSQEEDEGQPHCAQHPSGTELWVGDNDMQQGGCPCPVPPVTPSTLHVGTFHGQVTAASSEHPSAVLGASGAKREEEVPQPNPQIYLST